MYGWETGRTQRPGPGWKDGSDLGSRKIGNISKNIFSSLGFSFRFSNISSPPARAAAFFAPAVLVVAAVTIWPAIANQQCVPFERVEATVKSPLLRIRVNGLFLSYPLI